jgi:hypothetical protein
LYDGLVIHLSIRSLYSILFSKACMHAWANNWLIYI